MPAPQPVRPLAVPGRWPDTRNGSRPSRRLPTRSPQAWSVADAARPVAGRAPRLPVERRTGFRRQTSGHAFYAEEARRALGVRLEHMLLTRVPAPAFHGAIGLAVAATAVLARPQRVGHLVGGLLDLGLVIAVTLGLAYYDRLVCPQGARPGVDAGLLPLAALLTLLAVLDSGGGHLTTVAAALGTGAVIGWAPHLAALTVAGLGGAWARLGRELIGVVVMAPALLVASSDLLPAPERLGVLAVVAAVTLGDTLRTGRAKVAWRRLALIAPAAGVVTSLFVLVAGFRVAPASAAVAGLAVWYGLRGVCEGMSEGRVHAPAVAEGLIFIAAGAAVVMLRVAGG